MDDAAGKELASGGSRGATMTVAIIGGRGRGGGEYPSGVTVRRFGSPHDAGNGALKRLLAAIGSGRVDLVVMVARWFAHSASSRVRGACQRAGVPCIVAEGGESSVVRAVRRIAVRAGPQLPAPGHTR
jgi:hypothetical protein